MKITESVQEYYGKILQASSDLKTNACCTSENLPKHLKKILSQLPDEVLSKFYGCGSPIPQSLSGQIVLDLGCGTGRDVFICSALVGPLGKVIGLDMTDAQLDIAKKYQNEMAQKFGFNNTEFVKGFIEDLSFLADNSVDCVLSNCVINLSPNKAQVFQEIFRVLKPGGELYFSDVFADRRMPEHLQADPDLYGECLSGAMYWQDFRRTLFGLGVSDFRKIKSFEITIENEDLRNKLGLIRFDSKTIRAFKIDLEDQCEDYGQVATYLGGCEYSENAFSLDDHHLFELERPVLVCGNTADMILKSRFAKYFKIEGEKTKHFGLFDCSEGTVKKSSAELDCC
jgi:SAM-dependent methyltransferase